MMKLLKNILLVFVFLLSSSCKNKSNLDFEKQVMNEIFSDVLDSVYRDRRLIIPPPPKRFKKEYDEYCNNLKKIKKDTSKPIVVVEDSVKGLLRHVNEKENNLLFKSYKIDLSKLKYKKRIILVYSSKMPKEFEMRDKFKINFAGKISFSRIRFDSTMSKGVFSCSYFCGSKAGQGYDIYIKKIKNMWVIGKIERTWIS